MFSFLSTAQRGFLFFFLLAGGQAWVAAGLSLGWSLATILTGSVGAAALAGWVFLSTASVVKTVFADFVRHARHLSQGDLTQEIPALGSADAVAALRAMQALQAELRKTIGAIRTGADEVSTASSEIAIGNQDLSQRTEQTASNLQQTASALSQLTGNVRQSAESASQANQLASSAAQVARRGGTVVAQVVATMD